MAKAWLDDALACLEGSPVCGYRAGGLPACEPTALAALALHRGGRAGQQAKALDWLADLQQGDGSVGIDGANPTPCWPTGWALLAWRAAISTSQAAVATSSSQEPALAPALSMGERGNGPNPRWANAAQRAAHWILALEGRTHPRSSLFGHDTTLRAWPWVEHTHSWVEPTAINLLALKASGQSAHPRCREAVAMLLDRMCAGGGWNYGNTKVLGAALRPQVQPTGLALAALAGEPAAERHVARSLAYLERSLSEQTTTASLCFGLMGLSCHGRRPKRAEAWLEAACHRVLRHDASPYPLALIALAACQRGGLVASEPLAAQPPPGAAHEERP